MEVLAVLQPMLALLLQSVEGFRLLAFGVSVGTACVGAGAGMGYLIGQTISSVARQPEAEGRLRFYLFLGIGLVEAFAIYGIAFGLFIAFGT